MVVNSSCSPSGLIDVTVTGAVTSADQRALVSLVRTAITRFGTVRVLIHVQRYAGPHHDWRFDPDALSDGVNADGSIASDAKTLWPQTEYIKACVARAENGRDPRAWSLVEAHLRALAAHYMRPDGATWHNQISRDGASMQAMTPARVLYHLFLAIAEVDRVRMLRG